MILFNLHTHRRPSSQNEIIIRNAWLNIPVHTAYPVSCGIHPWFSGKDIERKLDQLAACLQAERVVAVGECGLDRLQGPSLETQLQVFHAQVELADQYRRPMILHVVRCFEETIAVRRQMRPEMPWVIHGFRGNAEIAKRLVQNGIMLSFGAALLQDAHNQQVFSLMPADFVFLETDTSSMPLKEIYAVAEMLRPGISLNIIRNAARIFPQKLNGM